tara:strand:+ start:703 stop:957 length:255 start_codon:yes stop_codon:yes gene_type:complete
MKTTLMACFISAYTAVPVARAPAPVARTPIEASSDLERDAKALELYLQDKKGHKEFCPQIKWNQPRLSTYKKTLKSYLPKDCKK